MKPFLLSHLGLGDAIVTAGLAVELARMHGGLTVPCWKHNEPSVRSFFINHPSIDVQVVDKELANYIDHSDDENIIRSGHYSRQPALENEGFDSWMYRTAGVSLKHRWISDPLQAAAEKIEQAGISQYGGVPMMFMHEDLERGFGMEWGRIKLPSEFRPYHPNDDNPKSILCYADVLKNAHAINVINSSFHHLAESLHTEGELSLHLYARPYTRVDLVTLRKPWNIIK